ncbi:MAG: hypothetical protein LBH06_05750 [Rikenellaceae bacterium]|jgi:YD repeat-containing protein|nr:hypothetical protein [Rikenellaceae bacterium]
MPTAFSSKRRLIHGEKSIHIASYDYLISDALYAVTARHKTYGADAESDRSYGTTEKYYYDPSGRQRLFERTWDDGRTDHVADSFEYDENGRITGCMDAGSPMRITYNDLGKIASSCRFGAECTVRIELSYDGNGRLTDVVPESGNQSQRYRSHDHYTGFDRHGNRARRHTQPAMARVRHGAGRLNTDSYPAPPFSASSWRRDLLVVVK